MIVGWIWLKFGQRVSAPEPSRVRCDEALWVATKGSTPVEVISSPQPNRTPLAPAQNEVGHRRHRCERADAPRATHMRQSQQAQPVWTGHYDVTPVQMHDAEGLAIESSGRRRVVEQDHIAALRVRRFDLRNAVLRGGIFEALVAVGKAALDAVSRSRTWRRTSRRTCLPTGMRPAMTSATYCSAGCSDTR